MSSHAAPTSRSLPALGARSFALPRPALGSVLTCGIGAALAAIAFVAQGGLTLDRAVPVELALLLGSGVAVAVAVLAAPRRGPLHGVLPAALFAALGVLTLASVAWASQPSDAWVEAGRTLSYVAVLAAGIALVRIAPERWRSLVGGVALAGLAVSGYALLTKVFPGALAPDETYARLRAPFGYWNAVGLEAALAVPPVLWLGARREGSPVLNALALPALGLLLVALVLSYSRGALLALAVGLAVWLALTPLRLRAVGVLAAGVVGAGLVVAWTFSQAALSDDGVALDLRVAAGHHLGLLLLALVLGLAAVGLLAGFGREARPLSTVERRRAGLALLCGLALVPFALGGALAHSQRGLSGSISYGWHQLTDPAASNPSNGPGRLAAVGSARARYWRDALAVGHDRTLLGVGAGGYATVRPHYRQDLLVVQHAHGYLVQTFADLGVLGLVVSLAALGAWLWASARTVGVRRRDRVGGGEPGRSAGAAASRLPRSWAQAPERIGMLTLVAVVVIFGVHSLVDWTWFVPGTAALAVLCAGWVAGRGPLAGPGALDARRSPLAPRAWLRDRARLAVAAAVLLVALGVAWATWQPLRSADATDAALAALDRGDAVAARQEAMAARDRDPLALEPLDALSLAESQLGDRRAALGALQQEVRLQPGNPRAWRSLADFQLNALHQPRAALRSLAAALYLDPRDPTTTQAFLQVRRQLRAPGSPAPVPVPRTAATTQAPQAAPAPQAPSAASGSGSRSTPTFGGASPGAHR